VEVLDRGRQVALGLAAVEDGDAVARGEQPPDDGRADEARAADDQDAQETPPPNGRTGFRSW
jgi:hypothetical protein